MIEKMEVTAESTYTFKLDGKNTKTLVKMLGLAADHKRALAKKFLKEWRKTQRALEENLVYAHEEEAIFCDRLIQFISEATK